MINVFIADEWPVVREGLKLKFKEFQDLQVVGEASDGKEVLSRVTEDVQVLLLDLSMPGRHGLELLEDLKQRFPRVAVLIFSIHDETALVVRAIRAGAAGYLTKNCALNELVAAIRKVATGHKYITEAVAEKLACSLESSHYNHYQQKPHENLSVRELQVMLMIAAGKPIKDIAQELSLSPKTITTYRNRTLRKMGVQSNADLTRYTIEHRLGL